MLSYNPKEWFSFIFRFHKGDTFRKLIPVMVGIGAYSAAIGYLEIEYWQLSQTSHVKNITVMHTMLGFVISLLLVFRTNTAYDRWWEGRRMWGALVNNSRNLAIKLAVMLKDKEDKDLFKRLIPAYASILNLHLKNADISHELFDDATLSAGHYNHKPNQVAKAMMAKVNELYTQGKLTGDQLIILNAEVLSFTDICGACERIKNTPIPYSYSAFIKKFIFFYVMTLPFGYVFQLGYYVVPVVVFIFYVLASLELIAEEIEDPFGTDANDLPLDKISENIKRNVEELLY
ncbi:bestrophin family protein [Flavobacterium subsaxonicum]|uniref:Membrane protein n=1 Tax=Flavobacterium subsaxonicum WB 4.1-42 = DSM 21790 TaxID=1121898 RepID=A0A0A2MK50_9FLAO|nr:bestrophin family ion channel [Flavobacterium subsaxonicum]KGO91976.1 membrane protein [Flavobacterium subsaxonicum WB 4.1-42 = DSM 21790]